MTAWVRSIAAILPAKSIWRSLAAVMSVANLTTLAGLPFSPRIGLYVAWIHTGLPSRATRLNSPAWYSPSPRCFQNSRYAAERT